MKIGEWYKNRTPLLRSFLLFSLIIAGVSMAVSNGGLGVVGSALLFIAGYLASLNNKEVKK